MRRKTKHKSKKVQNISISQIKEEICKVLSYLNTNNHTRSHRKKSSKVSFKRSIDTSDPDIYKINLCVTVPSPLMNQQRRVSHFMPLPVVMILIKIDVKMPSADMISGLVQIKFFRLHFVKSAQDQIKSFQL